MARFEYTHENHFQFGLVSPADQTPRWFEARRNAAEKFVATYGRSSQSFSSWRAANGFAARLISERAIRDGLTPTICFSGGIDSEVTLLSFLSVLPVGRPIDVATLYFTDGTNDHDTSFVDEMAKRLTETSAQVRFQRFELDPVSFLSGEDFRKLALEFQVVSPAVVCQIWLCREIQRRNPKALPIIGQGEMHLVRDEDLTGSYRPAPWSIVETENLCGLYRYFIARGLPAVPGFFQYLPEQFETQLRTNPVLHELLSNSRIGKLGTRTSKSEIIRREYPELIKREKFTGFENLTELYDIKRLELGNAMSASEAKWKLPLPDFIDGLRPLSAGVTTVSDWSFAWGIDSGPQSARVSSDDMFASAWVSRDALHSAFSEKSELGLIREAFLVECRALVDSCDSFLHDGSNFARLLTCLAADKANGPRLISAPQSGSVAASDLMSRLLQNPSLELDTLVYVLMAELATTDKTVIPLLHGRIINAELDRELETTVTHPRFVWTESERLAVLATALPSAVKPWTRLEFAKSAIRATRAMGWFDEDEPSVSNRATFERFLETCLVELRETSAQRETAIRCSTNFANFKTEIENALTQCRWRKLNAQVATVDLSTSAPALGASDRAHADLTHANRTSLNLTSSLLDSRLRVVSTARWLEKARERTPEIRLGSNLFFQQNLPGFSRLEPSTRVSVALLSEDGSEEVAWAHVSVLSLPPHGRLRIRGVTTRADLARRGYASKLLRLIVESLRKSKPSGFDAINVYAAPEVVEAFRRAGFVDDDQRITRSEEAVDKTTGQLVPIDRDLTPLTLTL